MKKQVLNIATILLVLTTIIPSVVIANERDQGQGRRPQGPPPEAIEACEGKSVGDSVTFTGRRNDTIEATCKEIDGQLVAYPDNPPQEGGPRHD